MFAIHSPSSFGRGFPTTTNRPRPQDKPFQYPQHLLSSTASISALKPCQRPSIFNPQSQHRLTVEGALASTAFGNTERTDHDYAKLNQLVKLREAKLADCSFLSRRRSRPHSHPAAKPTSPGHHVSPSGVIPQDSATRLETVTRGLLGGDLDSRRCQQQGEIDSRALKEDLERALGSKNSFGNVRLNVDSFQSSIRVEENPPKFCTPNREVRAPIAISRLECSRTWLGDDPSDGSTTTSSDSESEALASWAQFTWSFPISREQKREGVRYSDYAFDESGILQELDNSPVAIILTSPSASAPVWRPSPNDPLNPPRCRSLLHPRWNQKC